DRLDVGVTRARFHAVAANHLGCAEVRVQAPAQARSRANEGAVAVPPDEEPFLFELEERLPDGRATHAERQRELDLRRQLDSLGKAAVANAIADLLANARRELRLADQRHAGRGP